MNGYHLWCAQVQNAWFGTWLSALIIRLRGARVATYPTGSLESAAGWAGCSVSCPAAVEAVEQFAGVGVGLGHAELAGHGDLGLDVIGHAGEAHRERCWLW